MVSAVRAADEGRAMRRLAAAAGIALALLVIGASTAGAAALGGGCNGSATSTDGNGQQLDAVAAPGAGGTGGNPFLVDVDGTVDYQGGTPGVFHNHSWHVDVFGITVKSGGSANGSNKSSTSGTEQVDDYLPLNAVGLYYVSGGITADEGSCSGSAWVKIVGSPVGTIGWIAGLVATVLGAAGLVGTAMPLLRRGG